MKIPGGGKLPGSVGQMMSGFGGGSSSYAPPPTSQPGDKPKGIYNLKLPRKSEADMFDEQLPVNVYCRLFYHRPPKQINLKEKQKPKSQRKNSTLALPI